LSLKNENKRHGCSQGGRPFLEFFQVSSAQNFSRLLPTHIFIFQAGFVEYSAWHGMAVVRKRGRFEIDFPSPTSHSPKNLKEKGKDL